MRLPSETLLHLMSLVYGSTCNRQRLENSKSLRTLLTAYVHQICLQRATCQPILVAIPRMCTYSFTIYSCICLFFKQFDKRHSNDASTKMVRYMLHFKYIVSLSFKFSTLIFVVGLLIILICFKLHLLHPVYKTLTPRIHVIIAY